jgi:hypothetical protein
VLAYLTGAVDSPLNTLRVDPLELGGKSLNLQFSDFAEKLSVCGVLARGMTSRQGQYRAFYITCIHFCGFLMKQLTCNYACYCLCYFFNDIRAIAQVMQKRKETSLPPSLLPNPVYVVIKLVDCLYKLFISDVYKYFYTIYVLGNLVVKLVLSNPFEDHITQIG